MVALPPGTTLIPMWMYYSGLGAYFLAVILIGIIIFLSFKTPVFTWLTCIMKRSPLFLLAGRDNVGGFFSSKRLASSWAEIRKQGLFFISEGSFIFDRKSKLPIYLAHKEIGATINLEWPGILEQINERDENANLRNSKDYVEYVKDKGNEDKLIKLSSGKTIKISDLQQFFPLNINPSFIKSVVENEKKRATAKMDNIKIIAVIGFAVLLVCIGTYILLGRINEAKTSCNCNCEGVSVPGIKTDGAKPIMPELEEKTGGGIVPGGLIT